MRIDLRLFIILFLTVTSFTLLLDKYKTWKDLPAQLDSEAVIHSKPIQKQFKNEFKLGNGIYLSNNFDGARLNGVTLNNDSSLTILITPENSPVNPSPWYAFKIWADEKKKVEINFTYPEGIEHRYHPKLSGDGTQWTDLESEKYVRNNKSLQSGPGLVNTKMEIDISPDTLWVAAHEVINSKDVQLWINGLLTKPFIRNSKIGETKEGRAINVVSIENDSATKNIVVLARQHSSEVAGYLAMQSFIETMTGDSDEAVTFRDEYNIYLFPNINPDGVDNGHWRHNSNGIDLNRDWNRSTQPEIMSLKNFIHSMAVNSDDKFYLSIDFFSSREDIFYVYNSGGLTGNMPGLTLDIAETIHRSYPDYQAKIKLLPVDTHKISAESYLYDQYGMESVAIIIDEKSPKNLLLKKGEALSFTVMKLMAE